MNQSTDRSNQPQNATWFIVVLIVTMLIGGCLRFWGLSDHDFWFDESCTFIYVHHLFDWPGDSNLLQESTNLPYYFLLRGWVSLFGNSEAGYRSFSALAALLTIPTLGFVARKFRSDLTGMVCMVLVALNPIHIYYAQEARAYALWVLLLSVTLYLLLQACHSNRWKWWVAFGVLLLACLHLHYFTLFWVPACAVGVLLANDSKQSFRRWLISMTLVGLCFVPYFILAVLPAARAGGGAWITQHFDWLGSIPRTLWAFLPAGGYPAHLRGLSILSPDTVMDQPQWIIAMARTLPAIVMIVMFLWLIRCRVMRVHGDGDVAQVPDKSGLNSACGSGIHLHIVFGGLTLLPLLFAWLYSFLVMPNYLVGRYDLVAWPACMIWFSLIISDAMGSVRPSRRVMSGALIGIPLLMCSVVPIERVVFAKSPQSLHHLRADKLATLAGEDDLVIAFSYDRDYLLYYLHRAGFEGKIVSFPSWLEPQIGWLDTKADSAVDRAEDLQKDAVNRLRLIEQVQQNGGQVWLLGDSIDPESAGPRSTINELLIEKIEDAGYQIKLIDEEMIIYSLQ